MTHFGHFGGYQKWHWGCPNQIIEFQTFYFSNVLVVAPTLTYVTSTKAPPPNPTLSIWGKKIIFVLNGPKGSTWAHLRTHTYIEIGHFHHTILCTRKLSDFSHEYDLLALNPTQIL